MLMATKHAEVGTWALNITIVAFFESALSLTSPSIDFVMLIVVETYHWNHWGWAREVQQEDPDCPLKTPSRC